MGGSISAGTVAQFVRNNQRSSTPASISLYLDSIILP